MEQRAYGLIIFLPIIDIATAFTEGWALSIGAIIRTLLMVMLIIYVWILDPLQKKHRTIFFLAYVMIALSFIVNFFVKTPFHMMEEVSFTLKVAYYVTMLAVAVHIITTKRLQQGRFLQVTSIALCIVSATYWIAYFTKTNLSSYAYIKSGYSGWYFSANELSVIILILFALVLVHFIRSCSILSAITILLTLPILPMIGTKTALYGGIILFIPILLYSFITRKWYHGILLTGLFVLFIIYLPATAAQTNTTVPPEEVEVPSSSLLSSRDVYLADTKAQFTGATILRQLFGLGYAGNYEHGAKTIEMDFYDLFFSYGWLGTIILLLPLALLSYYLLRGKINVIYLYSLGTLSLVMGIAFIAGHVLFAPAVSTYVALFAIWTGSIANE